MLKASDARRALESIRMASDHPGGRRCTIKGSIGPSRSDETSVAMSFVGVGAFVIIDAFGGV
jgi:hypothetical protein